MPPAGQPNVLPTFAQKGAEVATVVAIPTPDLRAFAAPKTTLVTGDETDNTCRPARSWAPTSALLSPQRGPNVSGCQDMSLLSSTTAALTIVVSMPDVPAPA